MSIPRDCKRLIEVDFPIAEVSKQSAREKTIRHGHPSTLHLWWARRPLASCRSVLLGLLLPDPCDPKCPSEFKEEARKILAGSFRRPENKDVELRKALTDFVAAFADWDRSADKDFVSCARALVRAAGGKEVPLVVDPFAGGGSIPLEGLRLGCEIFASDLNPVASLILKALLEDIPRSGKALAIQVRKKGERINIDAEKRLSPFYPPEPSGKLPIAYLWARTALCEAPNCGAEIPLVRSLWLSKKSSRRRALKYHVERFPKKPPEVIFEIFEPKVKKEVRSGTVSKAKATCLSCGATVPPKRLRAQLTNQRYGTEVIFDETGNRIGGARLLVVVAPSATERGRTFRLPTKRDYEAVSNAQKHLQKLISENLTEGVSQIPDEPLPARNTLGLRVPNYGAKMWRDLFTSRQKLSLSVLAGMVRELQLGSEDKIGLKELLALAVSRTVDYCSANCSLNTGRDVVRNTWARNALPVVWDYYESNPFAKGSGNFEGAIDWVARVVENLGKLSMSVGQVQAADACEYPLPSDSADVWFTDPPYYNAIGYAESSDFFFVWLKRMLPGHSLLRDPYDPANRLTPKARECIQDDTFERIGGIKKDAAFFNRKIERAFVEGRRVLRENSVGCTVFAHKTTEGWEALLTGMLNAGWVITASWPIETEMRSKVSGSQGGEKKAMLLASIHLVCRPREENASVGDWADVLRELPVRVSDWMERLQPEGVRGADLVFACIGPALEIFSRYSRVETADERRVELPEFLEKVWEVVGRSALSQVLGADSPEGVEALEEDARLTALFLWTFQSTEKEVAVNDNGSEELDSKTEDLEEEEAEGDSKKGGYRLLYDIVRRFAQPLGLHLETWEGRTIETSKGVVRLLPVMERAKQIFGEENADSFGQHLTLEADKAVQLELFPTEAGRDPGLKVHTPQGKGPAMGKTAHNRPPEDLTTLDRLHTAMLLQAHGQSAALRELVASEMRRGPMFLRLANSLSALYPRSSEEKRLIDALLLTVP